MSIMNRPNTPYEDIILSHLSSIEDKIDKLALVVRVHDHILRGNGSPSLPEVVNELNSKLNRYFLSERKNTCFYLQSIAVGDKLRLITISTKALCIAGGTLLLNVMVSIIKLIWG